MHDAFISYSRADSGEFVKRLAKALEDAGKDVWVDLDDIPPADRWQQALREGVLDSGVFLFVLSPGAVRSANCRAELDHAVERNKRIVPVAHRGIDDADAPPAVADLNWVPQVGGFEDDFDASLASLLEAIETDQEAVREHARWQRQAEAWASGGHERSLLARGAELAEAERWLTAQAGAEPAPTAVQAEWVAEGRQASRRRQGLVLAGAGVAVLVSAVLGVVALAQRNQAREQRDAARAGELATASIANLEVDPELSLLLARDAVGTDESPRSVQTLERALLASHIRQRFDAPTGVVMNAVALSPDERLIATGDAGGTATVYDAETGDEVARFKRQGAVGGVDFTADSRRLVVGSGTGIYVFDLAREQEVDAFSVFDTPVTALDVSPSADRLAVGSLGGGAGVADLDGGHPVQLGDFDKRVTSVAFTADGSGVLTATNDDRQTVLWGAGDGSRDLVLSGQGGPSSDAAMSPDGRYIATANHDGSASLWDARSGQPIGPPLVARDSAAVVLRVAFVPGARAVVTAGGGGQVDAWDIDSRARIGAYRGHSGSVYDLTASADGQRIVTAGVDGSARVWDFGQLLFTLDNAGPVTSLEFSGNGHGLLVVDSRALLLASHSGERLASIGTEGQISGATANPAAPQVATVSFDGEVRVYSLADQAQIGEPFQIPGETLVTKLAWSADGERLMTADLVGGVRFWSMPDHQLVGAHLMPSNRLFDAAISPDGTRAAVVTADPAVGVYDADSGKLALELKGHTDQISSVAYDTAGDRIVTASEDGTARIWDADSGEQLLVIANDGQAVRAAAFNGDGSLLATSSAGGELRVWDATSGDELSRVQGANWKVALSPLGSLVAGAVAQTDAPQTSVYECDVCGRSAEELLGLADSRVTRELTDQERERYLSGE